MNEKQVVDVEKEMLARIEKIPLISVRARKAIEFLHTSKYWIEQIADRRGNTEIENAIYYVTEAQKRIIKHFEDA